MVRCGRSFALILLGAAFIFSLSSASCPFGDDDHHHHQSDAIIEPGDRPMDFEGKHSDPHSLCHDHDHGHTIHHSHFHACGHHVHSHEHEHDHSVHHKHSDSHDHARHHEHSDGHPHDQLHDYGVVGGVDRTPPFRLQEEIAEEEELRMFGFYPHRHDDKDSHIEDLSTPGLWIRAMGCSLLVSMASLICLMLLPLIVSQGKPSQIVVDALAAFGAGAMLGDAFLHQLPHALGSSGGHSHGFEHPHVHNHIHSDSHGIGGHSHAHSKHSHAHSIQDLSVGLAVLVGIILFFIVEKIVRQVETLSTKGGVPWGMVHHHHHHHGHPSHHAKGIDEDAATQERSSMERNDKGYVVDGQDAQLLGEEANGPLIEDKGNSQDTALRKRLRKGVGDKLEDKLTSHMAEQKDSPKVKEHAAVSRQETLASNLVLGYLNLFSDGVHNFTDGMALGSAFLLHGTIGGWSRTLFLLAHELPQEVGDFGILVQSGFSVLKALAFNFLSALMALAGTALALLMGGSSGQSSWIEGFTAGGFIYIAVAGVLPEMHQQGTTAKTTLLQLVALCLGMGVALAISLVE